MYFRKLEVSDCVIYNIWRNDRNDFYNNNFKKVFAQQLQLSEYNLNPDDKLIVDCCNEGIGPKDLQQATQVLEKYDFRVLFNAHITEPLSYKYETFVDHFSAHCGFVRYTQSLDVDWENLTLTKSFISLNRRASEGRCKLAKKLLDTFEHNTFLISCGSQPDPYSESKNNLSHVIHPYPFPILLDGETDGMDDQHYHNNANWFTCFINVVTETSNQTDANSWHEIFITEKSLKAFLYRQVPVFWAVPGTVKLLRDIGFDVYDDIIDHSYDSVVDPNERLDTVVAVLKNFIEQHTLNDMNNLRKQLWPRINKNVELLVKLSNEHHIKMSNKLLELSK